MAQKGYVLANADITVVAQKPQLAPYFAAMKKNLAAACRVDPGAINLKATTTEEMGFEGRGEGMSAHAVVLLKKPATLSVKHSVAGVPGTWFLGSG